MIADDNAGIRLLYKTLLKDAGHEIVAESDNGLEALETYLNSPPDLLIIDYKMGKMNGIDVVRHILQSHRDAKIIMCTASCWEIASEAMKLGVFEVVSKPFLIEDFIATISNSLETSTHKQ